MNQNITYAYIETTNYCNLRCVFCNRNEVVKKLKHMSIIKFKELLDKIKYHTIEEAKLMGMGEPFLHPKFNEICRLFKKSFPNSKLISSTNCQYKMTDNFKKSLKYIDILYLSIDGYKKNYEKYRTPAKWNKLIDFLIDLNNINKYNCKIIINYVVNPNNVYDIQKVYDKILVKYNIDELWLNIAQNWSEDKNMIMNYTDAQIMYIRDNWKENIKGKEIWDYKNCFWPSSGLYITVEGDVKMCCLNTNTKSFGNIFEKNVYEIKQTERFKEIKKGCELNNPLDHCKNCSYKELTKILSKIK